MIVDGLLFAIIPGSLNQNNDTLSLVIFLLGIGYEVWMTSRYGGTIGKLVFALRVIKKDGSKLSYSDSMLRVIAKFLSMIVFGLGFLWIIWDKKKQGWHDKIAGTYVIKI